jgi:hypothetical protein
VPAAGKIIVKYTPSADADSSNGFYPTTDCSAIGARYTPADAREPSLEASAWSPAGVPTGNRQAHKAPIRVWRLPAIFGSSGQMALAPIAVTLGTEVRQIIWVEAVAPVPNGGNNLREWRVASEGGESADGGRPGIGAFQPYKVKRLKH